MSQYNDTTVNPHSSDADTTEKCNMFIYWSRDLFISAIISINQIKNRLIPIFQLCIMAIVLRVGFMRIEDYWNNLFI